MLLPRFRIEAEQAPRGQLDVENSRRAQRAEFPGYMPRLPQPARACLLEQFDRAELVQGAKPPQRKVRQLRTPPGRAPRPAAPSRHAAAGPRRPKRRPAATYWRRWPARRAAANRARIR